MKIKMIKAEAVKLVDADNAEVIALLKMDDWKVEGEKADDLDALRAEAEALGLKPHHKAGPEKLKEMIAEAKA